VPRWLSVPFAEVGRSTVVQQLRRDAPVGNSRRTSEPHPRVLVREIADCARTVSSPQPGSARSDRRASLTLRRSSTGVSVEHRLQGVGEPREGGVTLRRHPGVLAALARKHEDKRDQGAGSPEMRLCSTRRSRIVGLCRGSTAKVAYPLIGAGRGRAPGCALRRPPGRGSSRPNPRRPHRSSSPLRRSLLDSAARPFGSLVENHVSVGASDPEGGHRGPSCDRTGPRESLPGDTTVARRTGDRVPGLSCR